MRRALVLTPLGTGAMGLTLELTDAALLLGLGARLERRRIDAQPRVSYNVTRVTQVHPGLLR
jgi:hypothetical protein